MSEVEVLVDRIIPNTQLRELALELAVGAAHPFYDTLFVAAALQERTSLLTFDRKLAVKIPEIVHLLE